MIAAERGDPAIVDALLRHGADPTLQDKSGKSARDLAANAAVRERLTRHAP
jgi:ankyrin repeat protein